MPAYEHLNSFQSGRYIRVHRGFSGMHHDEVDTESLGVHWVGDNRANIADLFATRDYNIDKGTVLTGLVHKRHLLDPMSEEYDHIINSGDGSVASEEEVPLRPGTPVHIIRATDFSDSGDNDHEFTPRIRGRA